ncbi:MAG: RIP metalloprotease RseP [Kiritimatiellia bacterium]
MDGSMMSAIFSNAYAVVAVILIFGFSVFVHEFGHFLAARACGLVVDVFSIGFGPAIWKRKSGSLTLKICIIPFGGYVALPQLDPSGMEAVQGEDGQPPRALPPVAFWKKIIVSLSGAGGNIAFAFVLAWIVYAGDRHQMPGLEGALVGHVETNTAAYASGLQAGDTVHEVNGQSMRSWNDFVQACAMTETVNLRVRRADDSDTQMTLTTSTNANDFGIRMLEGVEQGSVCKVGLVLPGSMAEKAGIKPGDIIKSFNGRVVAGRGHLIDMVQQREGLATPLAVDREGDRLELSVTPRMDPKRQKILIGIEFAAMNGTPLEQIRQDATGIFRMLKALVTPKQAANAAGSIGGPISIFALLWLYAKAGLMMLIWFGRFINVNLAILNLLPIPVLDGGHVVFALWEGIFRRPMPEKIVRFLINFFAALLIGLIVLLSFRDLKIIPKVMNLVRGPAPASEPAVPGGADSQTGERTP